MNDEVKEKKKKKDENKFQDVLDTINENPFSYFLKPLDNVKDFPNKVVNGMENFLESPFDDDNKPWYKINLQELIDPTSFVGFCQKKTDKPNSKKGIKTETIFKYEFEEKFGEFKEIFREKTISKYDSNGNGVEELYNKKDGRLSKVIYKNEYDTKNRRIEVRMYPKIFGGFKTPSMKTTYEYEEY